MQWRGKKNYRHLLVCVSGNRANFFTGLGRNVSPMKNQWKILSVIIRFVFCGKCTIGIRLKTSREDRGCDREYGWFARFIDSKRSCTRPSYHQTCPVEMLRLNIAEKKNLFVLVIPMLHNRTHDLPKTGQS